jgi:hypothetical protein
MSAGTSSTYSEGQILADEIRKLTDNQLIDRAADYNAKLRRGRKLVADGQAIIDSNINAFVMCQNELHHRTTTKVERETDLRG